LTTKEGNIEVWKVHIQNNPIMKSEQVSLKLFVRLFFVYDLIDWILFVFLLVMEEMAQRGHGTVIFTGATGSLRGRYALVICSKTHFKTENSKFFVCIVVKGSCCWLWVNLDYVLWHSLWLESTDQEESTLLTQ
jgi:hypothetical protein